MKNLKNMAAALSLMAVLGIGATTANAGIIITDGQATPADQNTTNEKCTAGTKVNASFNRIKGFLVAGIKGIIITDGLIMSDGLIVSDSKCSSDGLIMSD